MFTLVEGGTQCSLMHYSAVFSLALLPSFVMMYHYSAVFSLALRPSPCDDVSTLCSALLHSPLALSLFAFPIEALFLRHGITQLVKSSYGNMISGCLSKNQALAEEQSCFIWRACVSDWECF